MPRKAKAKPVIGCWGFGFIVFLVLMGIGLFSDPESEPTSDVSTTLSEAGPQTEQEPKLSESTSEVDTAQASTSDSSDVAPEASTPTTLSEQRQIPLELEALDSAPEVGITLSEMGPRTEQESRLSDSASTVNSPLAEREAQTTTESEELRPASKDGVEEASSADSSSSGVVVVVLLLGFSLVYLYRSLGKGKDKKSSQVAVSNQKQVAVSLPEKRNLPLAVTPSEVSNLPLGEVYLLKAGPFYKIGKSKNAEKRIKQIKLQLPYPVEVIHIVQTTEYSSLERYWHVRFKSKRTNGEWFILTDEDVQAFIAHESRDLWPKSRFEVS